VKWLILEHGLIIKIWIAGIMMSNDKSLPNIYQRINAVMKSVKYIQKDKAVVGGGANYKAVTHDKVVSECRAALVSEGVVIYPEQLNHSMPIMRDVERSIKMHLYSADYAIHFVNMDNPEDRISVTINAQANDNGDKAPGKAVTYATKTAILKVLCLETGENDESRVADQEVISPTQLKGINSLINGDESLLNRVLSSLDIARVEDIQKNNYELTVKNLQRAKKEAAA